MVESTIFQNLSPPPPQGGSDNVQSSGCFFGPSGVLALPVTAGTNIVAIVLWIIFIYIKVITFLPERRLLGYQNFSNASRSQE